MPHKDPEARRAYQKARYWANHEAATAKARAYYNGNIELRREYNAAWAREHSDSEKYRTTRRKNSRKQAGIIGAHGDTRGGPCEICGDDMPQLHLDHDHTTGAIRGWLCRACNQGLGLFRDNPTRLGAAIRYLGRV